MLASRRIGWPLIVGLLLLLVAGAALVIWQRVRPRPVVVTAGKHPEELVYARSRDDVVNGGVMFTPPRGARRSVAVIWVHGWGTNFHAPTYTVIGRELAGRGFTTLSVNTRMHDIGTVATHRYGRRVRGGGYWGIASEQTLDLAAWVDFAARQDLSRVILAGHSAGWAAVARYQVDRQDPRVVGVVLASGSVGPLEPQRDAALMAQAQALVQAGAGDDLLRLPNRSFPSFISAATYLDIADTPAHLLDFFGIGRKEAGIAQLRRPLLAFFGTRGDVGGEAELEVVRSTPRRLSRPDIRVDTASIDGADHMYTGEEAQVARIVADWIDRIAPSR